VGQLSHFSSPLKRKTDVTRISATQRRAALVQAALRVVAARGVQAATTRAIVAEAGMSLASFHYAFESRDELMSELVTSVVAGEERALGPVLSPPSGATGNRRTLPSRRHPRRLATLLRPSREQS
jgi:DNA-binding transcriptional regulator YbjK